jgi:hypothetical protein
MVRERGIVDMAKERKRKKRKKRGGAGGGPSSGGGGGGVMQSMVRGFRRAAGVEKDAKSKSSWLGNLIWVLLIAVAVALAVSRFSR